MSEYHEKENSDLGKDFYQFSFFTEMAKKSGNPEKEGRMASLYSIYPCDKSLNRHA